MAKIAIIGAGLTGLSTAYHLEKRGFFDYKLFEKDANVGGLCRSVMQDGFTFDYTGHLLHVSDPYFQTLINDVVGMHNLNSIHRRSFIYSQDVYTRYPYQINLYGLPTETIVECIEGFVTRPQHKKEPKNFCEWVVKNFGEGIAKHFFYPFQSKILAYDLNDVSTSWMGRFVPQTSLQQMIKGAITDVVDEKIGYNSSFVYPKQGGINFWITKIAHALQNPIYTNHAVTRIDTKTNTLYFANGETERFDTLINTMPLDTMLTILEEKASTSLKKASDHLVCNSVVNFNIGVSRYDLSDKHWIYFPETKYPFYRVGFPHNFAESMTPAGCSSLYGELAYIKQPHDVVNARLQESLAATKKLFSIAPHEIATEKIIHISHAYVIYNFWREKNLPKLLARLEEQNIHSIGRYGEWKYSSMQEAILDGKKIAEKLTIMPAKPAFYSSTIAHIPDKQKEL